MKFLPVAVATGIAFCVFISCREKEKPDEISLGDTSVIPTMLTRDVSTLISDSGYTRYHIVAPIWLMFENAEEPNWKFPEGMEMEKYDDNMNVNSTIVCDSATYLSQKKIWRLDGNVRMVNIEGDKFLTQQLFWDQIQRKVYSDSFIHIERSNRIMEGYGFVSNEQMTQYTVNRPSGIFPIPEREHGNAPAEPAEVYDDSIAVTEPVEVTTAPEPEDTPLHPRLRKSPPIRKTTGQ